MGKREPIIAANWKMHKTVAEAREYVRRFRELVEGFSGVEIVLAPPFTALPAVREELCGTAIALAAQDMWHEPLGAYTGAISPLMLRDLGCQYVIIGHSERREHCKETDELINKKLRAAFAHGLTPILCVGEKLEDRRAGLTQAVLERQVRADLAGLAKGDVARLVIAYEPVWAIGTGETASPQDANEGAKFIRALVAKLWDEATAQSARIQYGGSVKPENIAALMAEENVDGALVGGASLDPAAFAEIVRRARG
ncbi:MAG: triose-phosphate isomerase [Candidatus Acetothermia bacterium]|jgi:triosephosphate isomerase|nr:triose-phosphate isomerase [Candidatus Acetothermia bacterium]MDH7504984.1 triose-phosphate isomerase [Candidatus Acetothermia bacterium]